MVKSKETIGDPKKYFLIPRAYPPSKQNIFETVIPAEARNPESVEFSQLTKAVSG